MVTESEKYYRRKEIENHYVDVGELGKFYLSHVLPQDGTGKRIAEKTFEIGKDT